MDSSFCAGDIINISGLAIRVYTAYKDTPGDHRYIFEEVAALQDLIGKAAQHFEGTTISCDDRNYGQKVLGGCQSVLEDLNSLIGKYKRLASINRSLLMTGVKFGQEDIATLQAKLISNAVLLKGFVRRSVVPPIPLH